MVNVIIARNLNVLAILSKCQASSKDVMAALKRLKEFPNHQLTNQELDGDRNGWFCAGDRTLIRWTYPAKYPVSVVMFIERDSCTFNFDMLEKLDGWPADDPRHEKHLRANVKRFKDILERMGAKLKNHQPEDADLRLKLKGLENSYGLLSSSLVNDSDAAWCILVGLQNLGMKTGLAISEIKV